MYDCEGCGFPPSEKWPTRIKKFIDPRRDKGGELVYVKKYVHLQIECEMAIICKLEQKALIARLVN